uniref:WD_REPEATS_REGION domain-containing protein n=1 Tax=Panagrellus redivivus TaxID=6233 RepID=A0A7E4W8V8_PANRE
MDSVVPPRFRINSSGKIEISEFSSSASTSASTAIGGLPVPPPQAFYNRLGSRFKPVANRDAEDENAVMDGPGRRLRKNVANVRKHIDYTAAALNEVEKERYLHPKDARNYQHPHLLYAYGVLPVRDMLDTPADCVCTRFARAATNKVKCPVYCLCWNPDGKRLITGASSGEFTLWNGVAFNFETILQAHDVAIRAIRWSSDAQFMASADHNGYVKYWQPNMNNVNMFQAHKDEPVRGLTFSPTNYKLCTASDDSTARIFDFANCTEEMVLRGHGSDVRCVEWHPTKGLIVTGSRDSQQPVKLWDPRTGNCLATLHDHKNSVSAVQWNKNGNWLLTGARDHLIKLYDIRMMSELFTFKGHRKEVTSLSWHPIHETLFASGGGDGSVGFWQTEPCSDLGLYDGAHDQAIWALDWHPLGHVLATGSNDNNTKFWGRSRPGDTLEELGGMVASGKELHYQPVNTFSYFNYAVKYADDDEKKERPLLPGLGVDETVLKDMRDVTSLPESIPGLPVVPDDYAPKNFPQQPPARRTLIKQAPPKANQHQFERNWAAGKPPFDNINIDVEPANMMPSAIPSPMMHAPPVGNGSLLGSRPPLLPHPPAGNNFRSGSLLGPPKPLSMPPPGTIHSPGFDISPAPNVGDSWRSGPSAPPTTLPPTDLPWSRAAPPPISGFDTNGHGFFNPSPTVLVPPTPFSPNVELESTSWKMPPPEVSVTSHGHGTDPRKRSRNGDHEEIPTKKANF